ncbi:MAG: hypothetical protein R2865_13475 [Deinococcales bacterium]
MIALLMMVIPLIAILVIALIPNKQGDRIVAALAALLCLILSLSVSGSSLSMPWLPGVNSYIALDGSGAGGLLSLLVSIIMFTLIIHAGNQINYRTGSFLSLLLLMQTGLYGIFLAKDLIFFYACWEITLISA